MLSDLFQDPEAEKLQLKAVTLLHDMIVERVGVLHHLSCYPRKPVFGFPTRSDTNQPVQPQKKARSLKIRIWKEEGLH